MNRRAQGPNRPRHARGAALLLAVLAMATLAAWLAWQSGGATSAVWRQASTYRQAEEARLAARNALASAEAQWLAPAAPDTDLWLQAQWQSPCPAGFEARQWQCVRPPLALAAQDDWALSATFMRDVAAQPQLVTVWARAAQGPVQGLWESRYWVPVLAAAPAPTGATLVLQGCVGEGARAALAGVDILGLGVPDTDGDGQVSAAERQACLPAHAQLAPQAARPRTGASPCLPQAWQAVLGAITPERVRAWSQAQALHGLDARSSPPRRVWWIDSPAEWTQSLGSPSQPVLLVFSATACASRCPAIASGVQIHGTVLMQAGCQDSKVPTLSGVQLTGQWAIEAGLPALGTGTVLQAGASDAQVYRLDWPASLPRDRTHRVPGSLYEGP